MNRGATRLPKTHLFVLAALVVAWRVAAFASAPGGERTLQAALGGLGLAFVASGLISLRLAPGSAALRFSYYSLCAGLHWGGPIGPAVLDTNLGFVAPYLVVSAMGEAFLLGFALEFGSPWRLSSRLSWLLVPAGMMACGLMLLASGADQLASLGKGVTVAGFGVSQLLAYAAAAVFVTRVLGRARDPGSGWVLSGLLLGSLPSLAGELRGSSLGDILNLAHVLIPILTPVGLVRSKQAVA